MARRFLDLVRGDITTLMADNSTGDITAAIQRSILTDIIDSVVQDECIMLGSVGGVFPTTETYQILSSVYESETGGDGLFMKPDIGAGQIQSATAAGWTYQITAIVEFEASNGQSFDFAISRNGVIIQPTHTVTAVGTGNTEGVSISLDHYIKSSVSDERYGVSMRSTPGQGSNTITIGEVLLALIIHSTNDPN